MDLSLNFVVSEKEHVVLEAAIKLYDVGKSKPYDPQALREATGFNSSTNTTAYVKRLALKGLMELTCSGIKVDTVKVRVPLSRVSMQSSRFIAKKTNEAKKKVERDLEIKVLTSKIEALEAQLSALLFQSPVAYAYRKWGETAWRGVDVNPPSVLDEKEWEFRPVFLLNHKPQEIYQHVKSGGVYEMLGPIVFEHNLERAIAYRKLNRGEKPEPVKDLLDPIWGRVESEFMDGRFVKVNPDTLKEVK